MIFTLAAVGLPGTNGFVGEFLILVGGFTASKVLGAFATTGVIIGAVYMIWLYQNVFFVETNKKLLGLSDINTREILTLVPLVILVFWIGIYPTSFLSFMDVSVQHLMERISMSGPQLSQQVGEILR